MSDQHTPSDCEQALDKLYTFLDGELTVERRRQIEEHLLFCRPCVGAFDFEAELKVVVASRCRDQVPEALRARVALAIAEAAKGDGIRDV